VKLENGSSLTKLKLVQGGYQNGDDWDWFYEAVKNAWPNVLEELKMFLEK
jgi:hypothetical protein